MTLPLKLISRDEVPGQLMLREVGGARGEMARGISVDTVGGMLGLSNRLETGATTSKSASLAIAEVAALQTGQKCDAGGPGLRSAQEWNWAPRNTTARSSAKSAILVVW